VLLADGACSSCSLIPSSITVISASMVDTATPSAASECPAGVAALGWLLLC
jgi:hypothetical protein